MIGKGIRHIRKARKYSQKHLAKKVGININHFSRIENDVVNPKHKTILKIAKALDVHVVMLYWFGVEKNEAKNSDLFEILKPDIDDTFIKIFCKRHF